MEVWIARNGSINNAIVVQSSGKPLLDRRAEAIVRRIGRFDPVPPEVSAGHDLILITSRFRFTREAGFEATTQGASPTSAQPAPKP